MSWIIQRIVGWVMSLPLRHRDPPTPEAEFCQHLFMGRRADALRYVKFGRKRVVNNINAVVRRRPLIVWAVMYDAPDVVSEMLIWPDLDVNQATAPSYFYSERTGVPDGSTALHVASLHGEPAILNALLRDDRTNVNARTAVAHQTPAWIAAQVGNIRALNQMICMRTKELDVSIESLAELPLFSGWCTPEVIAHNMGFQSIANLLADFAADREGTREAIKARSEQIRKRFHLDTVIQMSDPISIVAD
jgi:hypothetical protein